MNHKNEASNMIDGLHNIRIYSFTKEIELYKRASYIVFLSVKSKINNFIKRIKRILRSLSLVETSAKFVIILEQVLRVFTDLLWNFPKSSPRFSLDYEGTEKMFYFLTDV